LNPLLVKKYCIINLFKDYIIIVAALIGITFFYRFLTERDDDED